MKLSDDIKKLSTISAKINKYNKKNLDDTYYTLINNRKNIIKSIQKDLNKFKKRQNSMSGGVLPADHWINVNNPPNIDIFVYYFPDIIPHAVFGDNFDLVNFPRNISNEHMNDFIMYQREIVEYMLNQEPNRINLQIAAAAAAWLRPVLPVAIAAAPAAGGFKNKYLKYKQKYLNLKATLI